MLRMLSECQVLRLLHNTLTYTNAAMVLQNAMLGGICNSLLIYLFVLLSDIFLLSLNVYSVTLTHTSPSQRCHKKARKKKV
jgi:hypothetical protein